METPSNTSSKSESQPERWNRTNMSRLLTCLFSVMFLFVANVGSCFGFQADAVEQRSARPNIVWIVVEDMSAHFGCYGETTIRTPHVDRLAAEEMTGRGIIVP